LPAGNDVVVETARLRGRRLTQDDLAFVSRVWNDERVSGTIGGARTTEQLRERIGQWDRHWERHGFGVRLFHERTTAQPIGWGGLQHSTIGIGECLTVGYVLSPDAWGRGYATEIAVVSVAYALEVLHADELFASVLSTNTASRRVLEKSGLTVHQEIDHGGQVEVIYLVAPRA
jgi:RimJ/RimL family protein N-acetyltransferase